VLHIFTFGYATLFLGLCSDIDCRQGNNRVARLSCDDLTTYSYSLKTTLSNRVTSLFSDNLTTLSPVSMSHSVDENCWMMDGEIMSIYLQGCKRSMFEVATLHVSRETGNNVY
jgi:hypothetical protein